MPNITVMRLILKTDLLIAVLTVRIMGKLGFFSKFFSSALEKRYYSHSSWIRISVKSSQLFSEPIKRLAS